MSLKFKNFVSKPFEEVLTKLVKHEFSEESSRLAFKRFRNAYIKNMDDFKERYQELQKQTQERVEIEVEEDKKQEHHTHFMTKIQELCECDSELKPMDYSVVKNCVLNQLEWDILELVLENIPE